MNKLIIANLKMNFSLSEVTEFCESIIEQNIESEVILAIPAPYLAYLANKFVTIKFSSQNISEFNNFGAYTGEYSATMLKSCDVNYALIGHSERRIHSQESDEIIATKLKHCLNSNVIPIICIGESAEIRENADYKQYILQQLSVVLPVKALYPNVEIIIAYEPLWSIGTNIVMNKAQLTEIFAIIRSSIDLFIIQNRIAITANLVYGGSVNLDNMQEFMSVEQLSGLLIGRSALNPHTLFQIVKHTKCSFL